MLTLPFYTYVHTRNDTSDVFYVGKGSGRRAYERKGHNKYWDRVSQKHGYTVHISAYFSTESEAMAHEKRLIAEFRKVGAALCNMTDGGEGISGHTHTPASRQKMSLSQKRLCKVISQEQRALIASNNRSRTVSDATRAKMSAAHNGKGYTKNNRGKVASDITRAKMSAARKGRATWNKGITMPVRSIEHRTKLSEAMKAYHAKKKSIALIAAQRKAK